MPHYHKCILQGQYSANNTNEVLKKPILQQESNPQPFGNQLDALTTEQYTVLVLLLLLLCTCNPMISSIDF